MAQLFAKRPETVEAIQYRPHETCGELTVFLGMTGYPDGCGLYPDPTFPVETWQGPYDAQPGDWIVKDSAGQVHVYTAESFCAAYAPLLEGRP